MESASTAATTTTAAATASAAAAATASTEANPMTPLTGDKLVERLRKFLEENEDLDCYVLPISWSLYQLRVQIFKGVVRGNSFNEENFLLGPPLCARW